MASIYGASTTDQPSVYTIIGNEFWIRPAADADYTIEIPYYKAVPALSASNTSNWLLASHPDIYLNGSLVQAEPFLWEPTSQARLNVWKQRYEEGINQLFMQDQKKRWGAGPLIPRSQVTVT